MALCCDFVHIHLVQLGGDAYAIFRGNEIPAAILRKYGLEHVMRARRYHFTAAVPSVLQFPPDELPKTSARAWFDRCADAEGVLFHRKH